MLRMRRTGGFKIPRKRQHHDPLYIFTVGFIFSSVFLIILTYLRPESPTQSQLTKQSTLDNLDSTNANIHFSEASFGSYSYGFFNLLPHFSLQSKSSRYDDTDRRYFESLASGSHAKLASFKSRHILVDSETEDGSASSENESCSDPTVWATKTYPPELVKSWSLTAQRAFIPFYIMGTLYAFVALAIICDEFFVASLEVIIEKTELSEVSPTKFIHMQGIC